MNSYSVSALVSLTLFGMAMMSLCLGVNLYRNNRTSISGRKMFEIFLCVFLWDMGYAWMGLCHGDDFAYIPRAIALFGIFLYMPIVIGYVSDLANYHVKHNKIVIIGYILVAFPTWLSVANRSTVSFFETPWGYWYTSKMGWGRILQFVLIVVTICSFYLVLRVWKRKTELKREQNLIKRFMWFGPILLGSCILDTILPTVLHTAAIPGSAIGAFGSAILLYGISEKYRAFGASTANVANYVFRDVDIPVLVVDYKGRLVLHNDIAPTFLGKEHKELMGLHKEDMFEAFDSEMSLNDDEKAGLYRPIGSDFVCRLETTVVRDEFDQVLFSIIFVQDVTSTLKAMEMMDEGKKAAEHANASKSAFLANMSHEIRTPMNAIMGMSDILLQSGADEAESKKMITNIKQSGEALLGIINDVLDISRLETGRYELVSDSYSVPDMVNSVNSIIKVKIAETPLEYEVNISPDTPRNLIGDGLRIRQILVNLLGNAIKFTEKGTVTMNIWPEQVGDELYMCADIKDTGIGIKEQDIASVFQDFQQVDTHRNRNKEGSGLGLAISRGLARLMDGDITVESVYGVGSVFHLRVKQQFDNSEPIGEELARDIHLDRYNSAAKEDELVIVPKPGKRVLIVDDSRVNLMVAKGLMNPYEMTVDTALSGKQAIQMVQENDYDIVFMDHMMPELDGVDTTHMIRELEGDKYQKLVIVALTANAIAGTREQLMSEGMQEFITKPINKKELDNILNMFLG